MKKIVLLVENRPALAHPVRCAIEREFDDFEVVTVETENDFRLNMDSFLGNGTCPLAVISEVMLPWVQAGPEVPAIPPEVKKGTFRKAGTRCWKLFRQHRQFQTIPWIYFTFLNKATIGFDRHSDELTALVEKDGGITPLLEKLGDLLHDSAGMRMRLVSGLNTPLAECVGELS